ncbi:hypothetical protein [Luteimonas aquatica]|uniref:hypothetical protein n=1 Tax=Luteimonas aquatica TaxID=450364 RepID=UPI001F589A8F|nr:hypothetical protein [Luteimonas aquatica]
MPADHLEDLSYVVRAVRHSERPRGVTAIYLLWAAVIAVGFALPDFAPRWAGPFWLVAGIAGGLASWRLGTRQAARAGVRDADLGRRYALHWLLAGAGFLLCVLPMLDGHGDAGRSAHTFMLVAGLCYALAGVHLDRSWLWPGLLMLAAYAVLTLFAPPFAWTISGLLIAGSLLWAGLRARAQRRECLE